MELLVQVAVSAAFNPVDGHSIEWQNICYFFQFHQIGVVKCIFRNGTKQVLNKQNDNHSRQPGTIRGRNDQWPIYLVKKQEIMTQKSPTLHRIKPNSNARRATFKWALPRVDKNTLLTSPFCLRWNKDWMNWTLHTTIAVGQTKKSFKVISQQIYSNKKHTKARHTSLLYINYTKKIIKFKR